MEVLTIKINDEKSLVEVYNTSCEKFLEKEIIKDKNTFLKDIEDRESIGSIRIYKDLLLPHLISDNINKTTVARVINYKEKILFLLLSNEDKKNVAKIKKIVENLLDRNYAEKIFLQTNDEFKKHILES